MFKEQALSRPLREMWSLLNPLPIRPFDALSKGAVALEFVCPKKMGFPKRWISIVEQSRSVCVGGSWWWRSGERGPNTSSCWACAFGNSRDVGSSNYWSWQITTVFHQVLYVIYYIAQNSPSIITPDAEAFPFYGYAWVWQYPSNPTR